MVRKFMIAALAVGWLGAAAVDAHGQARRQIKVVLQSQQTATSSQETLQGTGGVIVRRGGAQPTGRITAGERQTTVQRSSGIFTLVQDGGESVLTVATRVPQSHIAFYHDYARGVGYIDRQIVFTEVGTALRVGAHVLADGRIRLRLTPRLSYFSAERAGAIDLTEAATELIVPDGETVSLGGSTSRIHEVTRRILGYSERTASSEIHLDVTASVQ